VPLDVGRGERLLVVAPHPDDETIAAGGLMQRVIARGGTVAVVLVTAGDGFVDAVEREYRTEHPRPGQFIAYGERRVAESRAAMHALDSSRIEIRLLGFPDGGLAELLRSHWQRSHPWRSRTTGAADPPYDRETLAPDLPYDGSDLRHELAQVLRSTRPTLIALPDPRDTHPDHRATGVFALLAAADARRDAPRHRAPRLLSYLVHWPAWPPAWDVLAPSAADERLALDLPANLADGDVARLDLDDREIDRKRVAMAKYASQQAVSAGFLAAFVRRTEPFRLLGEADLRAARALAPGAA
jgi:LmbE family N-acetylglucosaminyl deacetylase